MVSLAGLGLLTLLGLTQPFWRGEQEQENDPLLPSLGSKGCSLSCWRATVPHGFQKRRSSVTPLPPHPLSASCLPLTPTSSLFHPTFPQGHPASANGPLAAMMKMDV